jgi:hypothetical protein
MKRKENHKKIPPSTPRFTKNNSESDEPMENCRSQQQSTIEARESAGQPITKTKTKGSLLEFGLVCVLANKNMHSQQTGKHNRV